MKKVAEGPVALVVLDGWGVGKSKQDNGIELAQTPNYDRYVETYPYTTLKASGEAVGLPEGQIGNSEVGHMTIGAGTVLYQDLVRIDKDIACGDFAKNKALQNAFDHVKTHKSQLHIMGLLSCGGVHGHEDHLFATLKAAANDGIKKVVIHVFLDGRDCSRTDGQHSLTKLEDLIKELGVGEIATMSGRYWSMDRDKNWNRTEKAFNAIWYGTADLACPIGKTASKTASECYAKEEYDELIEPYVVHRPDGTTHKVELHDAIIFTNFRPDRARQLSQKIGEQVGPMDLRFVTMTDYGIDCHNAIAYSPMKPGTSLAAVIADAGLKQVHIAETDKYAHATYFLNVGVEQPHQGEEFVLVPSRKDVKTHNQAPEMRAKEIADAAIEKLSTNDFIFANFANADMVGHTADQPAIKIAVETVDRELGRLVTAVQEAGGTIIVTADHGNAELMVDPETGEPKTSHTTNPVPFILINQNLNNRTLRSDGGLKDVAPTILELFGLAVPTNMTGKSLLKSSTS